MSKLDLVNKRFGHRGVDMIRFMASKDCYRKRGFNVDETEFKKRFCKCEECALAKINKIVCHRPSKTYSYEQGRFFYVDFSGPFEVLLQGNVFWCCLWIEQRD